MNKAFLFQVLFPLSLLFLACQSNKEPNPEAVKKVPIIKEFGFVLNDYNVVRDTVHNGDTFGTLLEENNIYYPQVGEIVAQTKKAYNIRAINVGKPFTILKSKDSLAQAKFLIYQPNPIDFLVVSLQDSIWAEMRQKEVTIRTFEAEGDIRSSLSETMDRQNLSQLIALEMSDIYAWTIDFFRLEKGDRFKVIYSAKYVNDSVYVGHDRIHAAYFEHRGEPFYAIAFETDKARGITEYFDENGKNLRRAFLRAPVQFSRISSRYNLKRKIAFYGRVKPHLGTDFAAPVGTPIRSTANGTVVKSGYTRGNGNYVTIRHNGTYQTQYLHMKKRSVRVGQHVKQGDVIGTVGMTGYTSGPHVCYRFWKNGKQVDPFRQKLPDAEPIAASLKERYLNFMEPIKNTLDCIEFQNTSTNLYASIQ